MKPYYLLGVLLALPVSAYAEVSVEARFDHLTITIIDLDPDDGVTPTLTWGSRSSGGRQQYSSVRALDPDANQKASDWSSPLRAQDVDSWLTSTAEANVEPGVYRTYLSAAQASLGRGYGQVNLGGYFVFSGKGEVVISLSYGLGMTGDAYGLADGGYAEAGFLGISDYNDSVNGFYYSSDTSRRCSWTATTQSCGSYPLGEGPVGDLSWVAIQNTSGNHDMEGRLSLMIETALFAPPALVPEPETWAMLLAGLGLVGVAARRRRG